MTHRACDSGSSLRRRDQCDARPAAARAWPALLARARCSRGTVGRSPSLDRRRTRRCPRASTDPNPRRSFPKPASSVPRAVTWPGVDCGYGGTDERSLDCFARPRTEHSAQKQRTRQAQQPQQSSRHRSLVGQDLVDELRVRASRGSRKEASGVATSTMRPSSMNTIRSATSRAYPISCVTIIMLSIVLFPEPLGPQTTTVSPASTFRLTSFRTCRRPYDFEMRSISRKLADTPALPAGLRCGARMSSCFEPPSPLAEPIAGEVAI